MFELDKLVRPNVKALKPYSSARHEYKETGGVFMDANENPFGKLNRYPDPFQLELKQLVCSKTDVPVENIFIGNGSDEIIDLCFRIFPIPREDKALIFTPTYGMYEVSASINDVEVVQISLDENFQIPIQRIPEIIEIPSLKLIFICSPNNPTGNAMNTAAIEKLLCEFNGIVVIDGAYIDFSDTPSWVDRILRFPNLIVLQTLSKAWGLAGARIGLAFANEQIIQLFNKIKPPYNVSRLNQDAAIEALTDVSLFENNLATIKSEKENLRKSLM